MKKITRPFFEFIRSHKLAIFKVFMVFAIVAAISVVSVLLLTAFGIIYFDGGIKLDTDLFHDFRTSWYGWIIFILLQTGLSILLCFIPGASMAFILISKSLYPKAWSAFFFSIASVLVSSSIMYAVGRFGGHKICEKMLGKEDCDKSLSLLRDKGTVFFPLMMMFPVFPDDALVMIAGTLKMSLKWFVPSILIGRGIGVAAIIFGLSVTDYLTKTWHHILFWSGVVIFVVLIFYLANKLSKYLNKRKEEKKHNEEILNTLTLEM